MAWKPAPAVGSVLQANREGVPTLILKKEFVSDRNCVGEVYRDSSITGNLRPPTIYQFFFVISGKTPKPASSRSIVRHSGKVVIELGSAERISEVPNSVRLPHKILDFYESPALQNNTNPGTPFKVSTGADYELLRPVVKISDAFQLTGETVLH